MCKFFSIAYAIVSKFEFIMANIMINDSRIVGTDKQQNYCCANLKSPRLFITYVLTINAIFCDATKFMHLPKLRTILLH